MPPSVDTDLNTDVETEFDVTPGQVAEALINALHKNKFEVKNRRY